MLARQKSETLTYPESSRWYAYCMIKYHLNRFRHPIRGIIYASRNDRSFRFQVYAVGGAVVIAWYLLAPLREIEILFLILAYFLVLITELQNSAFEMVIDRLHPEIHEAIGKGKDMAAGAVLLAGGFLALVILFTIFA